MYDALSGTVSDTCQTVEKLTGRLIQNGDELVKCGACYGDFNIFPWSGRVQRLARAAGAAVAGPVRATYYLKGVPLPIDLAMAPGGGSVELRAKLGSDHAGIVAELLVLEP